MLKSHIKKGDVVVVIAGTEKGKRGKVIEVLPKTERVLVEGVKMIKKHMRKSQLHPQGAIFERAGTIHISNVMLAEKYDARMAKRGVKQPQGAAEKK
jgi:large subunit ribosomal protein L24